MRAVTSFDLDRIGGRRGLDDTIDAVLSAGGYALRVQREAAAKIVKKPDASPVTEADRNVEKRIRGFLEKRFPEAGFLGEESGEAEKSSPLRWVLDPIDGTRAFIRMMDTWSVLLALEAEGEPVVGIAFLPATGELFVGVRGGGAYYNGRPCHLSQVAALDEALVCHGGLGQFTEDGRAALLEKLARRTFTQRGVADFANYRELLVGRADAVVDPGIQPYDVGPAAVLVREAGDRFTDLSGTETIHGGSALASNGLLHDALLALAK